MGKGFNSFLNFFNIDDDEYDDDEFDTYEEREPVKRTSSRSHIEEEEEEEIPKRAFRTSKPKVVPMSSPKMLEVSIIKPKTFEDSQEICNILLEKKPVVVNLEGFDPDDAQRIMDFISGCIYAINGKFHQISKYIFIFTPENVDISGDSLSFDAEGVGMVPTLNREF